MFDHHSVVVFLLLTFSDVVGGLPDRRRNWDGHVSRRMNTCVGPGFAFNNC